MEGAYISRLSPILFLGLSYRDIIFLEVEIHVCCFTSFYLFLPLFSPSSQSFSQFLNMLPITARKEENTYQSKDDKRRYDTANYPITIELRYATSRLEDVVDRTKPSSPYASKLSLIPLQILPRRY